LGVMREFPENRENNREFAKFSAILAPSRIKSRSNSRVLPRNSRRNETGNFRSCEQGNHHLEQGIRSDCLHG
jgi:hypothetical protein